LVERTDPPGVFEAQLPPDLASVVAARRLVQSAGKAWGVEPAPVGDAALAVSELAANAVLHAGTPMRVTVRRLGQGMRIEVEDGNGHLPVVSAARPEDLLENRSMTGRGLALVAAMADRWGADPAAAGKITWAEVGTGRRVVAPEPAPRFPPTLPPLSPRAAGAVRVPALDAATSLSRTFAAPAEVWRTRAPSALEELPGLAASPASGNPAPARVPAASAVTPRTDTPPARTASAITGGGRTVQFIGVPVALLVESSRHLADLQRELQVMAHDRDQPGEIEAVIDGGRSLAKAIDGWTQAGRESIGEALASGQHRLDFQVILPSDIHDLLDRFVSWLHRLAGSLVQRHLLTQPASEDVAAYREWYREEILSQLSGHAPRPCPLEVPEAV
jgi:anti-sigma regulatory factor (Ser/Thr protein kinase)